MKREILFRGKRIDNGEWVYGTPIYPKGYDKVIITVKYKCGDIAEVIFTEYGAFVGETESLSHENIGGVLTEVIGTIFDKEADNG